MIRHILLAAAALVAALTAGLSAQSSLVSIFDRYTVNTKWAQLAGGWGDAYTTSVAADGKGNVVALVRSEPYFRVFTTAGQPVRQWGAAGAFTLAHSVHFDPDGALWATDPDAHVIHKYDANGQVVMTLGTKGTTGDNASRTSFNRPNSVGFAANGDIYVSDGYGNSRIVQFTKTGSFVRIIGGRKGTGPGELSTVHGVAVDAQGRVLVNDADNKRVSVFDKDGTFIKTIAVPSRGGIQIAPDGTVYVSDVAAGVVTLLRNDQIVDVIKVDGRPHGLGIDPVTGDVYTASTQPGMHNVTKSSPKAPRAN
jgi:sugar lactone lactonase YvrE